MSTEFIPSGMKIGMFEFAYFCGANKLCWAPSAGSATSFDIDTGADIVHVGFHNSSLEYVKRYGQNEADDLLNLMSDWFPGTTFLSEHELHERADEEDTERNTERNTGRNAS